MDLHTQKQKLLEFMRQVPLGVLATVSSDGLPQAALVAISENENLELFFGTSNASRKYQNVMKNPRVAVTLSKEQERTTVQYEGTAVAVAESEREAVEAAHMAKNPGAKRFAQDPTQKYFKIVPIWVRYSNRGPAPHEIFEIKF